MKEIIRWISSIMLAICPLEQLVYTIKTGDTTGLTWSFIVLCTLGDFGFLYSTWGYKSWGLRFNYGFNAIAIGIIMIYKIFVIC